MVRFYPTVELAPGADLTAQPTSWSWTDLTQLRYVHNPAKITITRGRQDRYAQTAPSSCALTLLNPNGIWVPDNPVGTYYGLIDQNTPLRILNRPITNTATDAFGRTVSSGWGTADVGGAWTVTGGAASDYSVGSGAGRHTHPNVSTAHYSLLGLSITRLDVKMRVRVNALSTGGSQSAGLICRFVDTGNHRRAELLFATDTSITARLIQRSSGTDTVNSTAATGLTHSTSAWYWIRLQTGLTSARMRVWLDGTTEPATWLIDGSNGFFTGTTAGTFGCWSRREASNTNVSATIDFDNYSMVDGPLSQFLGYVDQWPTTWTDASERQSLAPITATGQLRRIGAGKKFKSALYRSYTQDRFSSSPKAVAYWPCEDESGSTRAASAIGGPPLLGAGMTFASDSSIAGSDPLMTLSGFAAMAGQVPTYPSSTTWAVRFVCKIPSTPASATILLDWRTPGGTIAEWQLWLTPGSPDNFKLVGWNTSGTELIGDTGINFTDGTTELFARQLQVDVNASQNGSAINWDYTIWFGETGIGRSGTAASATIANIGQVYIPRDGNLDSFTIGHIAVGTNTVFGAGLNGSNGFAGESTFDRFARLCSEENTPGFFGEILGDGSGTTSQKMGPQQTTDMQTQLREVEATEEGILFDGKQGQLTLLPRTMRQNHTVNLTLNHNQGQIGWPFPAVRDDYLLRTDVTASRVGGSSANRTDTTVVRQVGVYTDTVTVNTATDAELDDRANWRLAQGKTREIRYPAIELNLTRNTGLISTWLNCDIGSRIQVTNLPAGLPPDTLDLLLEGYTEVMDSTTWTATLNCSPARPWNVFTIQGGGNAGRLGSSGSTLAAGVNSSAVSLSVATPSGPLWRTGSVNFDLDVAGERVTVTNISGSSSPQTFTVTRAVNGVAKAQASGAVVKLWKPGRWAL